MKTIKPENKSHKNIEKDIKQKLNMFDRIPESCSACSKPFDRKDREQVSTWSVVVKNEQSVVNLYCPTCWTKATEAVKEYYGETDDV